MTAIVCGNLEQPFRFVKILNNTAAFLVHPRQRIGGIGIRAHAVILRRRHEIYDATFKSDIPLIPWVPPLIHARPRVGEP